MFDESGEPYRRRQGDPWWRFFIPVAGTAVLSLFGWGISINQRINNLELVQAERTSLIAKIGTALADPVMKPELRDQFEQEEIKIDRLEQRVDRLDERINNFHQYLLQARPTVPVVPLSKRGGMAFTPEDKG